MELPSLPMTINRVVFACIMRCSDHVPFALLDQSGTPFMAIGRGGNSIAPVVPQYRHLACLTSVQKSDAHPMESAECYNWRRNGLPAYLPLRNADKSLLQPCARLAVPLSFS